MDTHLFIAMEEHLKKTKIEITPANIILTPKQLELTRFLVAFLKKNGFSPSYTEIAVELHMASGSVAFYHVKQLIQKGVVQRQPNTKRGILLSKSVLNEPRFRVEQI